MAQLKITKKDIINSRGTYFKGCIKWLREKYIVCHPEKNVKEILLTKGVDTYEEMIFQNS